MRGILSTWVLASATLALAQAPQPTGWAAYEANRKAAIEGRMKWEELACAELPFGPVLVTLAESDQETVRQLNDTAVAAYSGILESDGELAASIAAQYLVICQALDAEQLLKALRTDAVRSAQRSGNDVFTPPSNYKAYFAHRSQVDQAAAQEVQALCAQGQEQVVVTGLGLLVEPNPDYPRDDAIAKIKGISPTRNAHVKCAEWFRRIRTNDASTKDQVKASVLQGALVFRIYGDLLRLDYGPDPAPATLREEAKGWAAQGMTLPLSFPPTAAELGYSQEEAPEGAVP
jgi:hypothetical protein